MKSLKNNLLNVAIRQSIGNKVVRNMSLKKLDARIHVSILSDKSLLFQEEKYDRYYFVSAVLKQVSKCLDRGHISREVAQKMIKIFMSDSFKINREAHLTSTKYEYATKYGEYPPKFLVLSPGKACNLECVGCYASCSPRKSVHLEFELTRRIIKEAHDILGSRFITISGGEPLMYQSQEKTILDIFKEFKDMFFLMYTNGTLINRKTAKKLAELGNVVPLISVEGFEKETDERRGEGVHRKIHEALENLRRAGVPFGISVTATSKNYETLLTDEFYRYYFDEMGATHMWQFQLMPIGKGKDVMDMMISPRQRVELYKKWEYVARILHYPMADFWNSSSLCTGCMAYGRWNGYFYIDFEGKITPCVFVPYFVDKIQDIYEKGGTLADALQSEFFKNGRKWQKERGFAEITHQGEYLMMPCSIRDHYDNFMRNIITSDARGTDEGAENALRDEEFRNIMIQYDQELDLLTQNIFDRKYRKSLHSN